MQQKFQGQGFNVKLEIEAARKLAANQRKAGGIDLDTFLSVNIADQFAARNVGPFLLKLGVCRQHLLNQASLKDLAPPDAVVDLMFFLKKEGLPVSQSRPTFEFFWSKHSRSLRPAATLEAQQGGDCLSVVE